MASLHKVVRVFTGDDKALPIAQFDPKTSPSAILRALKLQNGGLKLKGGDNTLYAGDHSLDPNDYVLIGTSGIRLRVACKGNKHIVHYAHPTHQIYQLMDAIALRFARFCPSPPSLKIAELRTIDGYLLNKYDRITEVVADGDHVEAIDYDIWITEQVKLCKEVWLRVSSSDWVDSVAKWCEVGKHAHGKLFVQVGKGKEVGSFQLFEVEDLREGVQSVSMKGQEGHFNWHASVSFVVDKNRVTAAILEVQALSDLRPTIKEIKMSIEDSQIRKGEIRLVQTADEVEAPGDERPLPSTTKKEVPIVDGPPRPNPIPLTHITAFQKLKIEQLEQVYADQTWAQNGTFMNNFYINFSFTNPNDTIVTIAKVVTEYQVGDDWLPGQTAIGSKSSFYNYRWNWNTTHFSIDAHQLEQVAVQCGISITGPQAERLRRAHHTLPQPLKIRVTFYNDQDDSSSVEVEYFNPPHELPTKDSMEKYHKKDFIFWTQLDDIATETRSYVSIARIAENENKEYYEIKVSGSSMTLYFYQTEFRRLAFEGVKEGKEEVEMEGLKVSQKGLEVHAYALVDITKRKVYAIKWTIQSNDAYLEDYFRVHPLKLND